MRHLFRLVWSSFGTKFGFPTPIARRPIWITALWNSHQRFLCLKTLPPTLVLASLNGSLPFLQLKKVLIKIISFIAIPNIPSWWPSLYLSRHDLSPPHGEHGNNLNAILLPMTNLHVTIFLLPTTNPIFKKLKKITSFPWSETFPLSCCKQSTEYCHSMSYLQFCLLLLVNALYLFCFCCLDNCPSTLSWVWSTLSDTQVFHCLSLSPYTSFFKSMVMYCIISNGIKVSIDRLPQSLILKRNAQSP